MRSIAWCLMLLSAAFSAPTLGQEPLAEQTPAAKSAEIGSQLELHVKFQKLLTGSRLVGHFTIIGKDMRDLPEETYEIEKVEKMADEDMWVITSRIKYGDKDVTVPVPLAVKWAGTTPVLTLDDMTLPGLGTFSARVVLHKDMYAGTWQHDAVRGHLFGKIVLPDSNSTPAVAPE